MSGLERRCRLLLRAYPAWYRRERSGEFLDTLLQATPPGRRWPVFREGRALVWRGLRARGWVWLASMLWMVAGLVVTGYFFYVTTLPFSWADTELGIEGWAAVPDWGQGVMVAAIVMWLALLVPVLFAGFVRFWGLRSAGGVLAVVWSGAWAAGVVLLGLAADWGAYPGQTDNPGAGRPPIGSPPVVIWSELLFGAGWLVLGVVMTVVLGWSAPGWRRAGAGGRAEVGPG